MLQKNGILRQISENNHLIENRPSNPFAIDFDGISEFKSVGINEVYTFPGFCPFHDTELFKNIESNSDLNFRQLEQQILFGYRGLCQELRRKEIGIEVLTELISVFPKHMLETVSDTIDGFKDAIKNMNFFKQEFETSMNSHNYHPYYFSTIEIPRLEVCISVPLNIGELVIPEDGDYEKWKASKKIPFVTSFINLFPTNNASIFIAGFHKNYPCAWTEQLLEKMKSNDPKVVLKEVSDLITLRLEFWAMSPTLFRSIGDEKLDAYKTIFRDNILNHSPNLKTDLCLFD